MKAEMRRRSVLAGGAAMMATGALGGCASAPAYGPFAGQLLGADVARGHALRDGRLPAASGLERRIPLLVLGGGVAGLAAGWRLREAGFDDFALLELEREAGGNARAGANAQTAFPWGAHYLPVPGKEAVALRHMLRQFGMITGEDASGAPIYDPYQLCADLEERLLWRGEWQEGLYPSTYLSAQDKAQRDRFTAAMEAFRKAIGRDGRTAFASPSRLSSADPAYTALDGISFAAWLAGQGFNSAPLLAYVRYACRDDYGCEPEAVSAWAGIHYFAGRRGWASDGAGESVLTWPEGNARLARLMAGRVGAERIHSNTSVLRVARDGADVLVDAHDHASGHTQRWRARAVVLAMPDFVARHVATDFAGVKGLTYAPWVVANVAVSRLPSGDGVPLAWDNVAAGSESLGYVVATHQTRSNGEAVGVLTWYNALSRGDPAAERRAMLARSLPQWQAIVAQDLLAMNPELEGLIERIDVWRWGHAMVRPTVGLRAALAGVAQNGPVFRAHSDLCGLSLFEEAHDSGVQAAERAMGWLGHVHEALA
ncbi:twin-arginine translocation pathway signal protein [Novosphingobium umbonatum]|uniref:Twin-arginine translocation pathway signal protein n=1 Tax=Novosphingobium umbonatum TaxID=1908524 RepID=A0A437N609_9SPHN|nr:NAD(P)-binding protein [Novosphingobium umbonatum]RVU05352.1 twin-arginine translocation pathway signal protein [Novosphingobium umbonatum]